MSPEYRAFYEWFHATKGDSSGVLLGEYREAFLAGYEAAKKNAQLEAAFNYMKTRYRDKR